MPSPSTPALADRVRFVEHKGQSILLLDFSHLDSTEDILRVAEAAKELVARQPLASLRTLSHVRGARYSPPVMDALKELAAHNRPYVRAAAVVGMERLHRVLFRAILLFSRRNMEALDSLEEAMDWLAAQP